MAHERHDEREVFQIPHFRVRLLRSAHQFLLLLVDEQASDRFSGAIEFLLETDSLADGVEDEHPDDAVLAAGDNVLGQDGLVHQNTLHPVLVGLGAFVVRDEFQGVLAVESDVAVEVTDGQVLGVVGGETVVDGRES